MTTHTQRKHGTNKGYRQHRAAHEDACRKARNKAQAARRKAARQQKRETA